jgi:hypothetical protein
MTPPRWPHLLPYYVATVCSAELIALALNGKFFI